MEKVIAKAGIVPVRAENSDASEMVTQMLIGETAVLLEKQERWFRVCLDTDGYEGWISVSQCEEISLNDDLIHDFTKNLISSPYATFKIKNDATYHLIPPSSKIILNETSVIFPFGEFEIIDGLELIKEESAFETALNFLGVPYLWGGKTDAGIDCSGLVQTVYAIHDIPIARDAKDQIKKFPSTYTKSLKSANHGDLVFFSYDGVGVHHVGFYSGNGLLLHAGGTVRLEIIDETKRNDEKFTFNERLSKSILAIQKRTNDLK